MREGGGANLPFSELSRDTLRGFLRSHLRVKLADWDKVCFLCTLLSAIAQIECRLVRRRVAAAGGIQGQSAEKRLLECGTDGHCLSGVSSGLRIGKWNGSE